MNLDLLSQRAEILRQMADLHSMELGSIRAEYRVGPSGEKLGPYHKHQVWDDGANQSRRVPADEALALETAIANRQTFEQLAARFIELTVRITRLGEPSRSQKKTTAPTPSPGKPRSRG